MVYFRYTSLGLSLSGRAGKVSYLHESCYQEMNCTTVGPQGERLEGPSPSSPCIWCGEEIT